MKAIFFIAMIPLVSLTFRWIFHLALISAGLTTRDALEYLSTVSRSRHRGRYLDSFITSSSPDPKRTSRILALHNTHVLIIAFCVMMPVIGTFVTTLDSVVRIGMVVVPVIIAAVWVTGIVYVKKRGITIPSLGEDLRDLMYTINKQEFERTGGSYTGGCIKLVLIVGAMAGIVALIISATYNPMTPATEHDIRMAIIEQDCLPVGMTEEYRDAWGAAEGELECVVICEEGGTRIDFFIFDTDDRARSICSQYRDIVREKGDTPGRQFEENLANYYIYTHTADDTYYALYCVDNTLIYAYCADNDRQTLTDILTSIGYIKEQK